MLEDEEENDDEKMEKFFALIKSTRDILSKTDKKVGEEKKEKCIWNPTFQLEDFIACEELGKSNVSAAAGPSSQQEKEVKIIEKEYVQEVAASATTTAVTPKNQNEDREKEKASDNSLDLNLSL